MNLSLYLAILAACAVAAGAAAESPYVIGSPRLPSMRDKTLVSWVTPTDLSSRGGSALTIERSESFDGIVFGELKPGAWMAGSEMFHRTQMDQADYPVEQALPKRPIRMAAVYAGKQVTLYRDEKVVASYTMAGDPLQLGSGSCILMGLRHRARQNTPNSHLAAVIDEARIYDVALTPSQLAGLAPGSPAGPRPVGRWTFEGGSTRDMEGTFPPGKLHGGAVIRNGKLVLDGKDAYMCTPAGSSYANTFHYRPASGNFADPIPFFWKGEYHVFYLQGDAGLVPWQHIVSKDLVHWRELPTALRSDGAPDSPDGGHMFTGSCMEHAGTFHIFYTGHNPNNPAALEVVRHATSRDLVHWTKDPSFTVGPDGVIYANKHFRNWRDPFVFHNDQTGKWNMVVIATDAREPGAGNEFGRGVQALLESDDLKTWTHRPPLVGGLGEECPDIFRIGSTWYMIGGGRYVSGPTANGPFTQPKHSVIDLPGVYAGKRMFDGKRHIWVGWAWDGSAPTDEAVAGHGVLTWGGFMCMPREMFAAGDGELGCRPPAEIVALHNQTAAQATPDRPAQIDLKQDGMVECTVTCPKDGEVTLTLHEQPNGKAYRLTIRPSKGEISLATPASEWTRDNCRMDASKPIHLRAFMDGSMLECFVNDTYAISRRIYDLAGGMARVTGATQVTGLRLRTIAVPPMKMRKPE